MHNDFIESYALHHEISYEKAEGEVVDAVYEIARIIAPKFRFAFHDVEDMVQQGAVEAFESFNKGDYDLNRPLRPFLRCHLHNRLFNFKRDNYFRMEIPCRCCEVDTPTPCAKYAKWIHKNNLKKGLANPSSLDFDPMTITPSPNLHEDMEMQELKDGIPEELRPSLLKVLSGQSITAASKAKLGVYLVEHFEETD